MFFWWWPGGVREFDPRPATGDTPVSATSKTTSDTPTEQPDWSLCGCGGFPAKRTSRYLPGHDAKHYAALKRAAKERAESKPTTRRRRKAAA